MPDRSEWFPVSKSQSPFYAGIDLGGTNIKTGLVDDLGRTLAYHREPTLVAQGPEDGAQRMGQSVLRVAELAGINVNQIARVGLGTPGTMDIPLECFVNRQTFQDGDSFRCATESRLTAA